jgi:hypothetical protein
VCLAGIRSQDVRKPRRPGSTPATRHAKARAAAARRVTRSSVSHSGLCSCPPAVIGGTTTRHDALTCLRQSAEDVGIKIADLQSYSAPAQDAIRRLLQDHHREEAHSPDPRPKPLSLPSSRTSFHQRVMDVGHQRCMTSRAFRKFVTSYSRLCPRRKCAIGSKST